MEVGSSILVEDNSHDVAGDAENMKCYFKLRDIAEQLIKLVGHVPPGSTAYAVI